jgi:hypothetical protein
MSPGQNSSKKGKAVLGGKHSGFMAQANSHLNRRPPQNHAWLEVDEGAMVIATAPGISVINVIAVQGRRP